MKPCRFKNLGQTQTIRVPIVVRREIESLLTVLDEYSSYVDVCEELSEMTDAMEEKLNNLTEER